MGLLVLVEANPDLQGDLTIEGPTAAKARLMPAEGADRAVLRKVMISIDDHGYLRSRM
jgi:hypothetical protein